MQMFCGCGVRALSWARAPSPASHHKQVRRLRLKPGQKCRARN